MGDRIFTKTVSCYYKGELYKIRRLEEAAASIRNKRNTSFSAAIQILIDLGVEKYVEDSSCVNPVLRRFHAITQFLDEAKLEAAKKQELAQVYRELGAERFFEIAKESGLDESDLLEEVVAYLPAPSRAESMYRWISKTLSDGGEHMVDDIIKSAISEGVLPDVDQNTPEFERALSSFRKVASNLGASDRSRRGKWQLKEYIN